jgi:hypothetical protein
VQISANHYNARGDETCEVLAEDAKILLLIGWTKVADSGERGSLMPDAMTGERPRAGSAIAALEAYAPTPLAETPRPSRDCWWIRQVEDVSPITLRRFPRVL